MQELLQKLETIIPKQKYSYKECYSCGDQEVAKNEYHYHYWSTEHETGYVSDCYLCDDCNRTFEAKNYPERDFI